MFGEEVAVRLPQRYPLQVHAVAHVGFDVLDLYFPVFGDEAGLHLRRTYAVDFVAAGLLEPPYVPAGVLVKPVPVTPVVVRGLAV